MQSRINAATKVGDLPPTYVFYPTKLPTPVVLPAEETFTEPITVTATVAAEGAYCTFTADGTLPTAASTKVDDGDIIVTESTVITVKAFKDGWPDSDAVIKNYTLDEG